MDFILQSERGAYLRDKTTYHMQELELKVQGGLMHKGRGARGIIVGFYGMNIHVPTISNSPSSPKLKLFPKNILKISFGSNSSS